MSLVGVGGVGKTALALAVAHSVRDRYPDGVWFVELAPIGDPESVPAVIAGAFGHQEQPGLTLVESLRRLLTRKELLLVVDNCEHVLEAVATFVDPLLDASSSLDILLTSREGLGLANEYQVTVAPPRPMGRKRPLCSCSPRGRHRSSTPSRLTRRIATTSLPYVGNWTGFRWL